jgi:hypothetical protein
MARTAIIATAFAGAMMLSAFPFAQATNTTMPDNRIETASESVPLAANANMLGMNMCGQRDRLVDELERNFNERAMAVGQVNDNAVVELFVSEESGTWTIIATGTDGMSCILSAGQDWDGSNVVRGVDA